MMKNRREEGEEYGKEEKKNDTNYYDHNLYRSFDIWTCVNETRRESR